MSPWVISSLCKHYRVHQYKPRWLNSHLALELALNCNPFTLYGIAYCSQATNCTIPLLY
jgi:hypothetical protein